MPEEPGPSPLSFDLNSTRGAPHVNVPPSYYKGLASNIITGQQLLHELGAFSNGGKHQLDVLTYSVTPFLWCDRIIYVVGTPHSRMRPVRVAGSHAKLYICYTDSKPVRAYIGSSNFVKPTLLDLNIKITDEPTLKSLAEFYHNLYCSHFNETNASPQVHAGKGELPLLRPAEVKRNPLSRANRRPR